MRAQVRQAAAALVLVFAVGGTAASILPSSASASPSLAAKQSKYGPGKCKVHVVIVPHEVERGDQFRVFVTGDCKHDHFVVSIHSVTIVLGGLTTDNSGHASALFTLPSNTPLGDHVILAEDAAGNFDTAQIIVDAEEASEGVTATTVAASTGGSGPLAFTGAQIAGISGGGAALVCLGGLLVLASRRRRQAKA